MKSSAVFISVMIIVLSGCGKTHPPEVRLRRYFALPENSSVTVDVIEKAMHDRFATGSSWAQVKEFVQVHGFGADGLSEFKIIHGDTIRCSAFYFPSDDARLKKAYEVSFHFDKPKGRLVRLQVSDIVWERANIGKRNGMP